MILYKYITHFCFKNGFFVSFNGVCIALFLLPMGCKFSAFLVGCISSIILIGKFRYKNNFEQNPNSRIVEKITICNPLLILWVLGVIILMIGVASMSIATIMVGISFCLVGVIGFLSSDYFYDIYFKYFVICDKCHSKNKTASTRIQKSRDWLCETFQVEIACNDCDKKWILEYVRARDVANSDSEG